MTCRDLGCYAVLSAVLLAISSSPLLAQPGGRGGFGGGGDMGGLLRNDEIRRELEVTDDQLADLEAMGEDLRNEMRSMFEGMRDLSPEERQERFQTMRQDMEDIRADAEQRMGDILLPHQLARLKEINLQQQVRRGGLQGALQGQVADELGITDEQREQMVEKAQELQQEMQAKIEEMRKEAQDELMSLLTADQRAKLESMMGSEFEMEQRTFGGFGQGGFGQGSGRFGGQRQRGDRGEPAQRDQ